jgi:hypothetical protein
MAWVGLVPKSTQLTQPETTYPNCPNRPARMPKNHPTTQNPPTSPSLHLPKLSHTGFGTNIACFNMKTGHPSVPRIAGINVCLYNAPVIVAVAMQRSLSSPSVEKRGGIAVEHAKPARLRIKLVICKCRIYTVDSRMYHTDRRSSRPGRHLHVAMATGGITPAPRPRPPAVQCGL